MIKITMTVLLLAAFCPLQAVAQEPFEKDVIRTSSGELGITFIGHGSLMLTFNKKIIHVDPFSKLADNGKLPKADVILTTSMCVSERWSRDAAFEEGQG